MVIFCEGSGGGRGHWGEEACLPQKAGDPGQEQSRRQDGHFHFGHHAYLLVIR